jgi:hypothetical protein
VFISLSKNIHKSKFIILKSISIFALLMSPLVLFDMRHSWSNFKALKTFFSNRESTINLKAYKAIPNIWPIWQDLNTTLLTAGQKDLGQVLSVALFVFATIELGRQLKARQLNSQFILIITWLGIGLVGLGLYKQHLYSHYYGFLFPAPFLLLGFMVSRLTRGMILAKILMGVLIVFIAATLIKNNPLKFPPNRQLYATQKISQFITTQSGGNPFNLALLSKNNYDAGYRYFFYLTHAPYYSINQRITEQLFVICELGSRKDCEPINHPLWEIASFGWAKIDTEWLLGGGFRIFRLVPNPTGS